MKNRKNSKTVQSVEEKNLGFFGRIKSRFKIKSIAKKQEKIHTQTKVKKQKKTKNGNIRKDTSFTTENQIKKIFRLRKNNPKLSTCDIARTVGMSDELVKYYLKKGREKALSDFRKKAKNRAKLKEPKPKKLGRPKKSTADKALDQLYKKEKYPTEHQSDPRYFAGAKPPQSVATDEAFQEQKRKNNINRAVVAKKLNFDKKLTAEQSKENARKDRLQKEHVKKIEQGKMKLHLDCCPSCNRKSNLKVDEYNQIIYKEYVRQRDWSKKQKLKEKELQEREEEVERKEAEGSVAEMAQKGTQLCRKCDSRIPYSQATRSFSIYGEYYCADHEPNPT